MALIGRLAVSLVTLPAGGCTRLLASTMKADLDNKLAYFEGFEPELEDPRFQEEQKRARELSAQNSANQAHDQINGATRKKKRTLLSRVLPFGILRGTLRGNRRSDYL